MYIRNKIVIWTIVLLTVFHIFVSATMGLGDDEAYYWQWSQHLALSYYDHPPLVAYLIKISTNIFGNNSFGIRAFNVILLPILSILIYKIMNLLYKQQQNSILAVLIFNVFPIFLLGSLLIAPDVMMLFCYVLGLYVFIKILQNNVSMYWYYLGAITGVGLLSKYMMIFMYLSVFLYFILDKKSSYWLWRKEPYIAFIISFIIFIPVIVWNYQHHWGSFAFQFYGRHNGTLEMKWLTFLSFWGAQVIFASPVFFIAFIIMLYKIYANKLPIAATQCSLPSGYKDYMQNSGQVEWQDNSSKAMRNNNSPLEGRQAASPDGVDVLALPGMVDAASLHSGYHCTLSEGVNAATTNSPLSNKNSIINNNLLLLCFSLPPLLIFGIISLITDTKPNWAVMSYIPLIILFAGNCSACIKTRNWGIGTSIVLAIIFVLQAYFFIIRLNPIKDDMTNDFYGWSNVAGEVRQFMQQHQVPEEKWFIFSYTYQTTSQLAYALNSKLFGNQIQPYQVYSLADHTEEYKFWQDESQLIGKNGLFFMTNFYHIDPTEWYDCADWKLYKTVDVMRVNLVARQVYLYECINYKGRKRPVNLF